MIPITIAPRNANTTPVVIMLSCSLTSDSCVKGVVIMPQFVADPTQIRYGTAANFCVHRIKSLILNKLTGKFLVNADADFGLTTCR